MELLSEDQLAWGDLGRFDVVMTGVRAYERRADLRAYNQRLLDYARAGGTVIVNYNKFEFNQAQYGPYPGKVGSRRVTDENSPVNVLRAAASGVHHAQPDHRRRLEGLAPGARPLLLRRRPTRSYTDLVEFVEPFPYNQGPKRGALVEAKVGSGRWIYLGIGLWRQLPAGTDGAYRLMANLISLGSATTPTATPAREK